MACGEVSHYRRRYRTYLLSLHTILVAEVMKYRCWTAPYLIHWYARSHFIYKILDSDRMHAGDYSSPREEERQTVWWYTGLNHSSY